MLIIVYLFLQGEFGEDVYFKQFLDNNTLLEEYIIAQFKKKVLSVDI